MKTCQEAEYTTNYKAIFEERKKLVKDYYAIGAVGLAFNTRCSLIFIDIRNNYQIVQRLSALRPQAFIVVFTYDISYVAIIQESKVLWL